MKLIPILLAVCLASLAGAADNAPAALFLEPLSRGALSSGELWEAKPELAARTPRATTESPTLARTKPCTKSPTSQVQLNWTFCATNADLTRAKLTASDAPKFPLAIDLVIPFKDPHIVPALHTSVFHQELSGKVSGEFWAPVVGIDTGLTLGSAAVLEYSTGGMNLFVGLSGVVQRGELPHSGLVIGFKGSF